MTSRIAPALWTAGTVAALAFVGCNRAAETPASAALVDAALVDAGLADAASAGATACASQVPTECVHPPVSRQCADGWCAIPAGCFVMGSPKCEPGRGRYSEPEAVTRLTHGFAIQQHEFTQAEWVAVGLENPSVHEDLGGLRDCSEGNCPVGNVNWYEALALANRMSELHVPPLQQCYVMENCTSSLGRGLTCTTIGQSTSSLYDCTGFRVPTEAEWEYAARGGTRTAFYSGELAEYVVAGCPTEPTLDGIAWYCGNGNKTTHPVAGKECNAWGLCDVLGNAGEWVSDKFDGLGYGPGPRTDPGAVVSAPVKNEGDRVIRGGSSNNRPSLCRAANRYQVAGFARRPGTGVRLVRTLP